MVTPLWEKKGVSRSLCQLLHTFDDTARNRPFFDVEVAHGRCLSQFLIRFLTHEFRVINAIRILRIGSVFRQPGWSERIDEFRERKFERFLTQFKPCCFDSATGQLAALICGELFFGCQHRLT